MSSEIAVDQYPYRLVDRENQGWRPAGELGELGVYSADYGFQRDLPEGVSYEELEKLRGPLKPVVPMPDEDRGLLRQLFERAGRRSVTSLGAAIEVVHNEVYESALGEGLNSGLVSLAAERVLTAGREGSWESELLKQHVIWWGFDLNVPQTKHRTLAERRASGPKKRVHREARDELAAMLRRWVLSPESYVEVAETLGEEVSAIGDEMATRAGDERPLAGWRAVADQYLMPEARMPDEGFRPVYNLFGSRSVSFDLNLL